MLFNSTIYIFAFLPISLIGFFALDGVCWRRAAISWLVVASAAFYAWFSVFYLLVLGALILFNYFLGVRLSRDFRVGRRRPVWLAAGITVNLMVLAYFKYMNFFIDNLNALGSHFTLQDVVLPIGISFFTFQKIAYLVDAYRGEAEEYDLLDFGLFVLYFPQLIAGPITHHREIIPQFLARANRLSSTDMAAGLVLFTMGLLKKVVIADTLVGWADPVFAAASNGQVPTFYGAWIGVLAFTFQIYFDFSGYTDMALGVALMMGIRLPLNFNSPYQAVSIVDFWRRWHMTLSRFLRDYLYFPLGGNRRGPRRRYLNLMLTMLIGGLWHGAAWTFVAWGGLHGLYLIINHGWLRIGEHVGWRASAPWTRWIGRIVTFLAVVFAWVFFRSPNFTSALNVLSGMVGRAGAGFDQAVAPTGLSDLLNHALGALGLSLHLDSIAFHLVTNRGAAVIVLLLFVWLMPNSQQLLAGVRPALQDVGPKRPGRSLVWFGTGLRLINLDGTVALTTVTGVGFALALLAALAYQALKTTSLQPFIYFRF